MLHNSALIEQNTFQPHHLNASCIRIETGIPPSLRREMSLGDVFVLCFSESSWRGLSVSLYFTNHDSGCSLTQEAQNCMHSRTDVLTWSSDFLRFLGFMDRWKLKVGLNLP